MTRWKFAQLLAPTVAAALLEVSTAAAGNTFVPPQTCAGPSATCVVPSADGEVRPAEYMDGRKLALQDYGTAGPNGNLYLLLRGDVLYVGIRLPEVQNASYGILNLHFDALRNETLGLGAGLPPRMEDRRFLINYKLSNPPQLTVSQTKGVGEGVDVGERWPEQHGIKRGFSSDPGFFHIEFAITLRPAQQGASEPVTAGLVGLGLHHRGSLGSWQVLPNDRLHPPVAALPASWETLFFSVPPGKPLSLASYNIGQMPDVAVFAGDGGSGEPTDFAARLANHDVVCVNEVWSENDKQYLWEAVNRFRRKRGLKPMNVFGMEWVEPNPTGLLILSSRGIIGAKMHLYDEDQAEGWDNHVDKGALWARVLLEGGEPPSGSAAATHTKVGDADHFVDVYCTHLQSGSEEEAKTVRNSQLVELKGFIDSTRAPDRPAFLMGDFNIHGAPPLPQSTAPEYDHLLLTLGIKYKSFFDSFNTWLNDQYDLGLTQNPVSGTNIHDGECGPSISSDLLQASRYDYILALPATVPWPSWGLAQTPAFAVDPGFVPEFDDDTCLSDHAKISANVSLIRTVDPLHWNPLKSHLVTYSVKRLIDNAAGGCCADWYTPFIGLLDVANSFSDDATPDGYNVPVDWSVSRTLSGLVLAFMEVHVWDWDSGPNDHYDTTDDGLDPKFSIDHASGTWTELTNDYQPYDLLGTFDKHPGGMNYWTYGSKGEDYGDVFHVITAAEL